MSLPILQTSSKDIQLMQTGWSQQLNPLISNPSLQSIILKKISLTSGANVINHLLGRNLQGWRIVRLRALASIYDTQDSNTTPQLTLQLVASAPVVCDLEVF